jgi:hypothetical protein
MMNPKLIEAICNDLRVCPVQNFVSELLPHPGVAKIHPVKLWFDAHSMYLTYCGWILGLAWMAGDQAVPRGVVPSPLGDIGTAEVDILWVAVSMTVGVC